MTRSPELARARRAVSLGANNLAVLLPGPPPPDLDFKEWRASLTVLEEALLDGRYDPPRHIRRRMIWRMRERLHGPYAPAKRPGGLSTPERDKRKTECKRGHALSGDNLQVRPDGRRRCIACTRMLRRRS